MKFTLIFYGKFLIFNSIKNKQTNKFFFQYSIKFFQVKMQYNKRKSYSLEFSSN